MNSLCRLVLPSILLVPTLSAQGGQFLFTTMQPEVTRSGSGATVLSALYGNEITVLEFGASACANLSAEKWAPRSVFHTQAGDADGDGLYFETSLFGRIDGLLAVETGSGPATPNQRTLYYSVAMPMATSVSGGTGLRPGDIGRIVRNATGDGQVEYFLRAEQLMAALGLQGTPASVSLNIDACTWGINFGFLLSLEVDTACNLLVGGATMVQDGAVIAIPPGALTWSSAGTVASVVPGSAVVAYGELAMDGFVSHANVTDRSGVCLTQVVDTDALDVDWSSTSTHVVQTANGPLALPMLRFAGQSMTGASVLTTHASGQIAGALCGPLGTSCGSGPTLGEQMGLLAPSATQGVASSINGLCSVEIRRFVTEPVVARIPIGSHADVDVGSPNVLNWMFLTFAPAVPGVAATSANFPWGLLCYPDYYPAPLYAGSFSLPTGFGRYTGPVVPFAIDLIFQAVTVTPWGTIEASTPCTIEVF